jgi:hypothetical protein
MWGARCGGKTHGLVSAEGAGVCMKKQVSGAIPFLPPNLKKNKINLRSASS